MIVRSLRAVRPLLSRLPQCHTPLATRRTLFAPTAIRSADIVQQMYLRELQAYKPAPLKPNDAEGQVQNFSVPMPPQSPEEGNIASGLKDYEAQVPEIEGQTQDAKAAVVEDWFEEDEDEEPAEEH